MQYASQLTVPKSSTPCRRVALLVPQRLPVLPTRGTVCTPCASTPLLRPAPLQVSARTHGMRGAGEAVWEPRGRLQVDPLHWQPHNPPHRARQLERLPGLHCPADSKVTGTLF
eukprot:1329003-Rhodomonas_salina.2